MIEAVNLTKRYGKKTAVDNISFTVEPGTVTGFLGPNGAGKSTTMRMIMGLDKPTSGKVTINGRPYRQLSAPLCEVGALLDAKGLHGSRSARNHLRQLAASNGIPAKRVDEVLDITGLTSVAKKRVKGFSLGMGQRLGIANALLGDPEVLLFDEPVNGLDPDGVRWVRDLMRDLAAQGRTILVSSHLMSEMSLTADDLVVIGRGRLLAQGDIKQFTESASHKTVHVSGPDVRAIADTLAKAGMQPQVQPGSENNPHGVVDIAAGDRAQIGHILHTAGLELHELSESHSSLEDVFMELTANEVEYGVGAPAPGLPAQSPDQVRGGAR